MKPDMFGPTDPSSKVVSRSISGRSSSSPTETSARRELDLIRGSHAMRLGERARPMAALFLSLLALAACAPTPGRNVPADHAKPVTESGRPPKTLTIAILREPTSLHQDLAGSLTTGGNRQVHLIA